MGKIASVVGEVSSMCGYGRSPRKARLNVVEIVRYPADMVDDVVRSGVVYRHAGGAFASDRLPGLPAIAHAGRTKVPSI